MKLYHSPISPFVRKVRALILHSGLGPQIDLVGAAGTPTATGTMPLDKNPLGKIPTLLLDDGRALYDSRVICRYLDQVSGAGLYPEDRLWDVLTLEATADGIMEAAVLMVYESRLRPEAIYFAPWVEGQWSKIARALDALETDWAAHLAGPLDMGQIALGCALGYLDFRHAVRDWRAGHPNLTAWEAEFVLQAPMQSTIPA